METGEGTKKVAEGEKGNAVADGVQESGAGRPIKALPHYIFGSAGLIFMKDRYRDRWRGREKYDGQVMAG